MFGQTGRGIFFHCCLKKLFVKPKYEQKNLNIKNSKKSEIFNKIDETKFKKIAGNSYSTYFNTYNTEELKYQIEILINQTSNISLKVKYSQKDNVDQITIWSKKPDVGFITNETVNHIPIAIKLANAGMDLFLEKPLSNSMKSINQLLTIVNRKKLVTLMGCNLRFHDCIKKMKSLLEKQAIGKIISVKVECGAYLPDWHPYEDYRSFYMAEKILGGGSILDQSHIMDLVHFLLGDFDGV